MTDEQPDLMRALEDYLRPLRSPTYTIDLTIDERPTKRETVSEVAYQKMLRLGWFEDGRAVLVDRNAR